jgi:hypothetical protein
MQPSSSILDILTKENLNGSSSVIAHLKQIATNHPYFSPAQFFLLQQMEPSQAGYDTQVAKTTVFFNNPHWLHFQLQPSKQTALVIENEEAATTLSLQKDKVNQTVIADENDAVLKPAIAATQENIAILSTENNSEMATAVTPAVPNSILHTETLTPENNREELITPTTQAEQPSPVEDAIDPDDTNDKEKEPFSEIPKLKIDLTATANEAMLFEPLHMVDYFRSQGIKLNEEIQPSDKLGKQLKSFTEWLKTMKKIHVADNTAVADQSDSTIQAMAEKSNTDNEVLTEAMAAVLASQGKAEKAVELYQKLSLLNPAKSAYFASKIEQLKGV